MNKITTTAGLLALGAVSVKGQFYAPPPGSVQAQKPWSVSASLRGFYDDNYSTSDKTRRRDSFGFEVMPSASVNLLTDQSTLGLSYTYSMRWYEDRDDLGLPSADHAHQLNAKLSHAFSERYKLDLSDSFVVAQEPDLLNPAGRPTLALRTDGDNIRNIAEGSFSAGLTENLDVVVGYQNTYWDFEQDDSDLAALTGIPANSRSSVLDRVEHLARVNLRQVVLPNTTALFGYNFEVVDYTSPGRVAAIVGPPPAILFAPAEARDNYSHYFYLGVDQRVVNNVMASLRGGVQYTKYHELDLLPPGWAVPDDEQWTPYVEANATWTYMSGSYAQLGVRHQRNPSDVAAVGSGTTASLNLDSEATVFYTSVSQRFLGKFVASLIGQYQRANYDMAGLDETTDHYLAAGLHLAYEFNRFVSLEAGYNYDRLYSEINDAGAGVNIPRSYTRNRVFVGVRATY